MIDPIVLAGLAALLGLIVARVVIRARPTWRLVIHAFFFAALTGLLLYKGIVPFVARTPDPSIGVRLLFGLAKIIWWMSSAATLAGVVRAFVLFEQKPREGRLLQDLVVGIIYIGAVIAILTYVFAAPIGTLVATSGLFAVILGLAMQSTLSDVFSGIALNIGRPYSIGDWIILRDGTQGKVIETNWRATHLLDGSNDLVVVPNSDLAKARLTNVSTPERSHGMKVTVRLQPTAGPSTMVDLMHTVLLSCNSILFKPEPTVLVNGLDAFAIEMELSFQVPDVSGSATAQNEIYDLVYRHALAAGLKMAQPPGSIVTYSAASPSEDEAKSKLPTPRRMLDALPLFATLTQQERESLAEAMSRRTYRKEEVIAEQGAVLQVLTIIRSGVVSVTRREGATERELGRLAPGDCVGEGGLLTGAGEVGRIRALTPVVVYEIDKNALASLMQERPMLVQELGAILARRAEVEKHVFRHNGPTASVPSLVARIRSLFDV